MAAPFPGMDALGPLGAMDGERMGEDQHAIDDDEHGEAGIDGPGREIRLVARQHQHPGDHDQRDGAEQQAADRGLRIGRLGGREQGDGEDREPAAEAEPGQHRPRRQPQHRRQIQPAQHEIADLVDEVAGIGRARPRAFRRHRKGLQRQDQDEQPEARQGQRQPPQPRLRARIAGIVALRGGGLGGLCDASRPAHGVAAIPAGAAAGGGRHADAMPEAR